MVKKGATNSRGPGYEGVDPSAECIINKTSKFAVWDAPGVAQPDVKPKPTTAAAKATTSAPVTITQKQNPNCKFQAAAANAPAVETASSRGGKNFPPTATLTCTCGEVVLSLAGPPLNRLECCCMDCKKALHWCHSTLRGPELTTAYVDLVYYPNCFQIEQGGEFLDVYMIKEGYSTKRIVATCCGTALMGDHPFYQGAKFVTYKPAQLKNCELMRAQRRIFEADNTPDEKATIPKFIRPPKLDDIEQPDLNAWKSKHPHYTTIQGLIRTIGPVQYMDPEFDGKEPQWNKSLRQAMSAGN